ncbi:hypothetical protein BDU57DRAFT_525324 [Ampelomyces quisqualis]|uniref:Uncharacterized protein n=1 Tax=Ampelomyces quisqualis TaxID=50730 RepID=A0A6A5QWS1_AMPQU|nr:hypothetical protein BDU57DRAFT_525324 [Ampelomyces quisqualis]
MPVYRAYIRSSDSMDYERTATLKELDELATAEDSPSRQEVISSVFQTAHTSAPSNDMGRAATAESTARPRMSSWASSKSSSSEKMVVFRDEAATARADTSHPKTTSHMVCVDSDDSENIFAVSSQSSHEATRQAKGEDKNLEPMPRSENDNDPGAEGDTTAANPIQLAQQLNNIAMRRSLLLKQLGDLQREESKVLVLLLTKASLKTPLNHCPPPVQSPSILPFNAPLMSVPAISPPRLPRKKSSKTLRKPTPHRPVSAPPMSTPSGTGRRAQSSFERVPLSNKTEELMVGIGVDSREAAISPPIHARAKHHLTVAEDLRTSTSRVLVDFGDGTNRRRRATNPPGKSLYPSGRTKSNSLDCNKGNNGVVGQAVGLQAPFPHLGQPRPHNIDGYGGKIGCPVRNADLPSPTKESGILPNVGDDAVKNKNTELLAPFVRMARSGGHSRDRSRDANLHHPHGLPSSMYRPIPQSNVRNPDIEEEWEF